MAEHWERMPLLERDGIEMWRVTGRTRKLWPAWWRLPLWSFLNDGEPLPPATYLPDASFRLLRWYLRNPFQNAGQFILGVTDRDYVVCGKAPLMPTTMMEADPPRAGWKWSVIVIGWVRLPFVSYESERWTFYAGWQPAWGFFGFKFFPKFLHLQVF